MEDEKVAASNPESIDEAEEKGCTNDLGAEENAVEEPVQTDAQAEESASVPSTKKEKVVAGIKKHAKRYFIDAFTGMAQGLFCTLIAGTILGQIASWCGDNFFAYLLKNIANIAKILMGAGIGVGIAHKLGAKPLVIFTAAVTGLIGAWAMQITDGAFTSDYFSVIFTKGLPGNPIGAYIVALLTVEVAGLYAGKTKLDIVLIPLGMMLLCLAGVYIAWPFIKLIDLIAKVLVLAIEAGEAVKIIVGIFVAVVMGVLLTMPTSSAAIWVSIATSSVALAHPDVFAIAGGAAVAGCAAHMVGFAVASFREIKWSGLISQGIGTSMLQIPNIMKRPI
ncbi:MAG: PTS sugar transporter subunit IIC, partial [Clostridia bacterium]|nr:PTS sugar transporter subunit IIC [Clostridia bacterium]